VGGCGKRLQGWLRRQARACVRAGLISFLEIACESAPAASVERGSCGELMAHGAFLGAHVPCWK